MRKIRIIGSIIIYILLFLLVGYRLSDVLRAKWNYSEYNAAQAIVQAYYEEPPNTLDILFLGASTIRNGMSPLEIYNEYGYTGYSRATSIQSPIISYYLLLETLEKHDIKVLIIDANALSNVTNNSMAMEGKYHEAIDYMPMSQYKLGIIRSLLEGNDEFTPQDFLIPLYRYHERWEELSKDDFTYGEWLSDYHYKGQYPILKVSPYQYPSDYMQQGAIQDSDFYLTNEATSYFDKMADVCKEHGIKMILVKTPVGSWDTRKHDMIQAYADSINVDLIDFNYMIQDEIGFDPSVDFCDDGRHPNISGAAKMSSYIGRYLFDNCSLEDKRDNKEYSDWKTSGKYYEQLIYDRSVLEENNLVKYLKLLKSDKYTVLIATRNDSSKYFTDELYDAFGELGLTVDMRNKPNQSYAAVISGSQVVFEMQMEGKTVNFCDNVCDHDIAITSYADKSTGNNASICIDGKQCSLQGNGFNFVIYDNSVKQIISRRTFDTGRTGKLYSEDIK